MADHFYSIVAHGQALQRKRSDIVVGAAATGANPIELRVTDGAMTAREVYQFCEYLSDLFGTRDAQVIPTGTILA